MSYKKHIQNLARGGVMAALVFLATWAVHVPLGTNGGYIHFGDALVYLSASVLPMPWAMLASAVGAGLSDLLSPGGAVWLLPTLLIKPLICATFTSGRQSVLCGRNIAAVFLGGLIGVVGYFIAYVVIAGPAMALAQLPMSFVQPAGSGACYIVLGAALDRLKIKQRSSLLGKLR